MLHRLRSTLVVPLDGPGEIGVGNALTIRVVGTGDRTISSVSDPRGNVWAWYKSPICQTSHVAWLLVCLTVDTGYQTGDDITITLNATAHWRGLVIGLPVSLAMWALLIWAVL